MVWRSNEQLRRRVEPQILHAKGTQPASDTLARVFTESSSETINGSSSRAPRVFAQADQVEGNEKPRNVMRHLQPKRFRH